jgi:predicted dehydrogenase
MNALRVAVVGVGHLGQHHARLLSTIEGVDLVGVIDIREERAAAIASEYSTTPYGDPNEVLQHVDAVSIAVPTEEHEAVAVPFLERGCAVLVEKPMAVSVEQADRMLEVADRAGAILAVGHTERFNPAVDAARPHIIDPGFVEVHRVGTFPDRSLDIDVVFDLMIHDLDLLLTLVASKVVKIEAVGVNVFTSKVDLANARLQFASGCIANLTASRIGHDRVRKARFIAKETYVTIDFASREAEVYRLDRRGNTPRVEGGKLNVNSAEPLSRELENFVEAVRNGQQPKVTGHDGRDALALATRIADDIAAQMR